MLKHSSPGVRAACGQSPSTVYSPGRTLCFCKSERSRFIKKISTRLPKMVCFALGRCRNAEWMVLVHLPHLKHQRMEAINELISLSLLESCWPRPWEAVDGDVEGSCLPCFDPNLCEHLSRNVGSRWHLAVPEPEMRHGFSLKSGSTISENNIN